MAVYRGKFTESQTRADTRNFIPVQHARRCLDATGYHCTWLPESACSEKNACFRTCIYFDSFTVLWALGESGSPAGESLPVYVARAHEASKQRSISNVFGSARDQSFTPTTIPLPSGSCLSTGPQAVPEIAALSEPIFGAPGIGGP